MDREHGSRWRDLRLLIIKSLEDSLSPEESHMFQEAILSDGEARRYYIDFMMVHSALFQISSEISVDLRGLHADFLNDGLFDLLGVEETAPAIVTQPERELIQKVEYPPQAHARPSKFSVFALVASAMVLISLLVYPLLFPVEHPRVVAQLTDTFNVEWGGSEVVYSDGTDMRTGYMELLDGFAHITFNCGAMVIVEGPAQFELESESEIFLKSGKVSCTVPPQAIGFTVVTPSATIVDFGTEFGVIALALGQTEAHVFRGEVELRTGPDPLVFEESRRLGAGQASTVDMNGNLLRRRFKARQDEFIRNELVPYEIAVRQSNPYAYWRFDASDRAVFQDVLQRISEPCRFYGNVEVVAGPPLGNGKIGSGVQLDGQGSYVGIPRVQEREAGDRGRNASFSYTFWVRPSLMRAQDIITATNLGKQQYRHIGLDDQGRLCFFTYNFRNNKKVAEFCGVTVFQPGRWYHVVVTGASTGKTLKSEMCLYVNGRQEASQLVSSTYSPRFTGNFHIGYVPEDGRVEGVYSFDGTVAEVVEYDRALMRQEVEAMYFSARL